MRAIYLRFDGIFDWIPGLSVVYLPGKEAACVTKLQPFDWWELKPFVISKLSFVKTFFLT